MTARRLLVPSLPVALGLALFLLCALTPFSSALISGDGDLALHVTHGRLMLERGGLASDEPTTFAEPGKPFVAHEWPVQLTLGLAHRACGLAGPVLLAGALIGLLFGGLFAYLRRLGVGPWVAVLVVGLAIVVARLHLLARPHLVTWALALGWLIVLERFRRGELTYRRWLPTALVVALLWVNAHGAGLFAFLLLGLYGLGALFRALTARDAERGDASLRFGQLFVAGLLMLAVSGINPWGFDLHRHVLAVLATPEITFPNEFQPLDPREPGQGWVVVYAALALLALLCGPKRAAPTEWVLTLGLGLLAVRAARLAPMFALLTAPLVAERLQAWLSASKASFADAVDASSQRLADLDREHGGGLTAAAVALAVIGAVGVAGVPPVRFDRARLPLEALEWVEQHPEAFVPHEGFQRAFATYRWTGLLAYRLHPGHRTYVNSFADHFSVESLERHKRLRSVSTGWEDELARFDWFLVERGTPLAAALSERRGLRRVHRDALADVYVRAR